MTTYTPPPLEPVFLDFETYYSATHSLGRMNPIEYVMHPETEIISLAIKVGRWPTDVFFGEDKVAAALRTLDWSCKYAVGHNMSGFDAMILAWRFGIRPRLWGCTLAMARPVFAKTCGVSLGAVARALGVGEKGSLEAVNAKGKHLAEFSPDEIARMREYNRLDTELCAAVFRKLHPLTSKQGLRLIDRTTRMLVEPRLHVDAPLLERTIAEERARKTEILRTLAVQLGVWWPGMDDEAVAAGVAKVLGSTAKFAALLESRGVPVPMKVSKTTGKPAPALAKTDQAFIDLQEHDDPVVQSAARCRLEVKSTQLETRAAAFLRVTRACDGKLPVALNYYGADTTGRWSGAMSLNQQNLPRVDPARPRPSDALRMCLMAPPDHKIVVADLSGIELRINHFLWQVLYSMALFEADPAKADLYRYFAAHELYHVAEADVTADQRRIGKISHLQLGFGASDTTFRRVAKIMGGVDLSAPESTRIVDVYRGAHTEIVGGWRTCQRALEAIHAGAEMPIDPWGLLHTTAEGIKTPKGMIRYPGLHCEMGESGRKEWWYGEGRHRARIYGAKVVENCVAAGTLVLTSYGWKPIERVTEYDLVHDGDDFVPHAGTVSKSIQRCIAVDGVYMTADHEVLTDEGWKEASQVTRPYRPNVRRHDRLTPSAQRWASVVLGVPLPVRGARHEARHERDEGSQARGDAELRMPHEETDKQSELHARNVRAPSIRCLAEHAGSVPAAFAPCVGAVRRAWDCGVRALAGVIRELLDGHAQHISAGAHARAGGQRRSILSAELRVGNLETTNQKSKKLPVGGHRRAIERNGHRPIDAALSTETRKGPHRSDGQTQSHPVYDILDAGPQHRFVVLGAGGPFIVHNCVQHLAGQVLADADLAFAATTLGARTPLVLSVHDELVYIAPDDEADAVLDAVQAAMRRPPTWWPQLVTWSEGAVAERYGEAK